MRDASVSDAALDRDAAPSDAPPSDATTGSDGAPSDAPLDADADRGTDGPCPDGSSPPCWLWGRALTGPSEEDEIDAVASDGAGNVYISGKFEETLTIAGVGEPLVSEGAADIMVVKLLPTGEVEWVRQLGGVGEDNIFDAVCDGEGNVFLSGIFSGTVDFGDIALSTTGPSDMDAVFVKMNPQGQVLWAVRAGSPAPDGGNEISVAPDGTLIAAADSAGHFGAGDFQFSLEGQRDSFLLALDPEGGEVRWARQVLGAGDPRAKCVGVDGLGNVLFGGDFRGSVRVQGPHMGIDLESAGLMDAFLSRWTADGELQWAMRWGGPGLDLCKGVVGTDEGHAYVTGYFAATADFDGTLLTSEGRRDQYAWRIDENGDTVWLAQIAAAANLMGAEVELAPDGGILFGVRLQSRTVFDSTDGNARTVDLPSGGGGAWPALVHYSPAGVNDWVILPALSDTGSTDEISRSGDRVYLDVPIWGGPFRFGSGQLSATGTKDAAITAIRL